MGGIQSLIVVVGASRIMIMIEFSKVGKSPPKVNVSPHL